VGRQRGVAIRTDDPEVVEAVVVVNPVDVVEDQRHPTAVPLLALTAQLAPRHLESSVVQPALQATAAVPAVLNEDISERRCRTGTSGNPAAPVGEVLDRDLPSLDPRLQRGVIAARG